MLFARLARAAQIDHGVRFTDQLQTFVLRHSDVILCDRVAKAPASGETEPVQYAAYEFDVVSRVGGRRLRDRIVDVSAVILDVVDLEAECAQSDQMVEQLPDDARERVSNRQMENNNPALPFHLDPAWDSSRATRLRIAGRQLETSPFEGRGEASAAPFCAGSGALPHPRRAQPDSMTTRAATAPPDTETPDGFPDTRGAQSAPRS